jgi:hypothetical protein
MRLRSTIEAKTSTRSDGIVMRVMVHVRGGGNLSLLFLNFRTCLMTSVFSGERWRGSVYRQSVRGLPYRPESVVSIRVRWP